MKKFLLIVAFTGPVLVACSDTRTPGGSELPSSPVFAPGGPNACKAAQNHTKYLTVISERKIVADALKAAEAAAPGSTARNTALFSAFEQIEVSRDANNTGDPSVGANLLFNAINCGGDGFTVTEPYDVVILKAVLEFGAWAFATNNTSFVQTKNGEAAAFPASGTWSAWLGGNPAVVFAYEVTSANFTESRPGAFQKAYLWGMILDNNSIYTTSGVDMNVEICPQFPLSDIEESGQLRVGRRRTVETVLGTGDIAGFCPVSLGFQRVPSGFLARTLQSAVNFFRPTPLQAARRFFPGVGGGSGSGDTFGGFSTYALVIPSGMVISFDPPPPGISIPDGFVDTNLSAKVCAATPAPNNTPLEGVSISLSISGNQGSTVVLSGGGPGLTDESGCVTISFSINKPGGYTMSASATFAGFDDTSALSNLFNLQQ